MEGLVKDMAEYSAGEISRAGYKIKLRVNDDGNWVTGDVSDRDLSKPTRDLLIKEIDRVLRLDKKAVHIPITQTESRGNGYVTIKHGVVTGIHSGTGNLLVAWDDGKMGQLNGGHSVSLLRRLASEEEAELTRLTKEAYEAAYALREYGRRKETSGNELKKQVERALAADSK